MPIELYELYGDSPFNADIKMLTTKFVTDYEQTENSFKKVIIHLK